MKQIIIILVFISGFTAGYAQSNFWREATASSKDNTLSRKLNKPNLYKTFNLDFQNFTKSLQSAGMRGSVSSRAAHVMSFPNADGKMERFSIVEAPTLHPDLSKKYPGIRSYAGQGIDNPASTIRFSVSNQRGFHGLIMTSRDGMLYIDPISEDKQTYAVYKRKDLNKDEKDFQCTLDDDIAANTKRSNGSTLKTNDQKLRKYRLAMSCNAEYGNIFAGATGTDADKKARILAQMNITMTRVNGIYERDLAITMEIVANNDEIIYYGDVNADPWSGEYNTKTQQTIDNIIGDANYDIGHNFNTSGGGNAGCIGCVCTSGEKGSGYTGSSNPTGDPFDVDFVAHEIGHQFGGYHTMNTCSRSGFNTEVEPASGSTIMGYAGICDTNIQSNSDAYFGYVNIRDISANIQSGESSGCAVIVNLSNNPPVADAGNDYTIPKSTPFVLKGAGSDPDGSGTLTYCWEQNDPEEAPGSGSPASTWAQGPLFRSIEGTDSPDRYMPALSEVLNGSMGSTWEVLPSVGRSMNFSLTVRDNNAGGGQTSDDLMEVVVDGSSGPFLLTDPNTGISWHEGQTQIVSWNVANTDAAPVNCTHVNILLSTDGGQTFPITLISNAPNNGTAEVVVPNNLSATCRVKIEAANNIFYDISNVNFEIAAAIACNATVPTGLKTTEVNDTNVTLSWDANAGAIFDVQYRVEGTTTWTTEASGGNSKQIFDLSPLTTYEVQVRSRCTGSSSAYSSIITFTTAEQIIEYCSSYGEDISDEYIGRVQLGSIDNTSAASSGYTDHTSLSTNLVADTEYTIAITPVWTNETFEEGYAVWIDYNQNGDFTDAGEQVWSKAASTETPVSGTFTVPATAKAGTTRMRVSMRYNGTPTSCEVFGYGEVEDYTVNILGTVLEEVSITSSNANNLFAKVGDVVTLQFTPNNEIQTPIVFIQGNSVTTSLIDSKWIATHTFTDSDLEGNVEFTIDYADMGGNNGEQVIATTDESTVTFDKTPPTLSKTSIVSNNVYGGSVATIDDVVTLTFTASEKIADPTVTISGSPAVAVLKDAQWRATRTMQSSDKLGLVAFSIAYADLAGNEAIVTTTSDNSSVEFFETITGVDKPYSAEQIKVYPNPASKEVVIETKGIYGLAEVKVVDFTGRVVLSTSIEIGKDSETTIDTRSLANGTYTLQVIGENALNTALIVISK